MARSRPLSSWTLPSIIQILELLFEFEAITLPEFPSQAGRTCGHFKKKPGEEKKQKKMRFSAYLVEPPTQPVLQLEYSTAENLCLF